MRYAFAIRTYGRAQLGYTLSSIYSCCSPCQIILSVDEGGLNLTPAQSVLRSQMQNAGFKFSFFYGPPGAGASLFTLIRGVYHFGSSIEQYIFMDDDVIFRPYHVTELVSNACFTYAPLDPESQFNAKIMESCKKYPMIDMYCSGLDSVALTNLIPIEKWYPLQKFGGMTDLIFFSGVLRLHGFKPNVYLGDDRPLHLMLLTDPRKNWVDEPVDMWDDLISQAYDLNYEQLVKFCEEMKVYG